MMNDLEDYVIEIDDSNVDENEIDDGNGQSPKNLPFPNSKYRETQQKKIEIHCIEMIKIRTSVM